MEKFVEEALKSEKIVNRSLILKEYDSVSNFLCDLLDYIYQKTNERKGFNDIELINIERYVEKYNEYNDEVYDKMRLISDRAQELNRSVPSNEQKKLKKISCFFQEFLSACGYDSSKSQVECVELGHVIDKMIFENHELGVFDLIIQSDKIHKFRYKDGELLVNKVLRYFKASISKDFYDSASYYSRLIFELLKKDPYKVDTICNDLREYKITINDKEKSKILLSLVDKLTIIKTTSLTKEEKETTLKRLKHNFDIHNDFSKEIETIESLTHSRKGSLVDLRHRNIITIDQKYKTAFDDAISIEKTSDGYLLSIYITDVDSFVDSKSLLYKYAKERGESIYGDKKNTFYIPMFPLDITRDLFSLNKQQDKYVIVHDFYFSDDFDFIKFNFYNGIININNNYTFDSIEHIKSSDTNYDMIYMLLKMSEELSYIKNKQYHKYKEKTKQHSAENSIGSNIIETSTIFLNSYIANYCSQANYPLIYKVHEPFECKDNIRGKDAKSLIRRCNTIQYSTIPKGHPVNNNKPYAQMTNPIRSYASLLNQHFFSYLFLDLNRIEDIAAFKRYWRDNLPYVVEDLNRRLEKNKEFLSVVQELDSKRLTKK